ncbi:fatty-acid-binding protein 2 isoform X2 [Malania oleifera]|uniref:fatty-acid-binding protein 2 isoform X2 n=1 Tax=Malania oleifera TaxID=397392 RepID=UPI0025ADED6F|nr:fatty-acid-binding protein 2 isoform X2 [Malania oleifera]
MHNSWFFFMDLDGGSPYIVPTDPLNSYGIGSRLFSHFASFADNSIYQSQYLHVPGSVALQEAFNCISKLAGALVFWFSSSSNYNTGQKLSGNSHGSKPPSCKASTQVKSISSTTHSLNGFCFKFRSSGQSVTPVLFNKISKFTMRHLCREAEWLQSFPVLSLAAALVPPFKNVSPEVLAVQLENPDVQMHGCMDQRPCEVGHQGCADLSFLDLKWTRPAVEPKTGIEFPIILDSILDGENNSTLSSEVLVGTGSRTMTIVRIKSLKVYAFGFYVHPYSVCEKLGPKYASIPISELNKCRDFYEDLLSAFEKSLRNRLLKMNPDTDCHCLRTFGSCFKQDIPLPAGTTVDFRRTADGQLVTEIGGNQIGAVHSKDLCRAFFDMYIGDIPVSEQTKEEIGMNVAGIMRRC